MRTDLLTPISTHMEGYNYYRIKTAWKGDGEDGAVGTIKTEELVYATSYTEAEKIAYALIAQYGRDQYSEPSFEIIKTKIEELVYNQNLHAEEALTEGLVNCFFEESDDTGVGLYGVKVMFITVDERSGKEKRNHSVIYVPAKSNADASKLIGDYLNNTMRGEFVVRDAKFDHTSAILWPKDHYQSLTQSA